MVGKRSCIERITRASTVPSPRPASNTRTAGGRGWILASSRSTRLAISHFSLHVLTNSRYFWRLSKKRKLRCGSSGMPLATGKGAIRTGGAIIGTVPGPPDPRAARRVGRPAIFRHERANAIEGVGGDAAAVAQPAGELAVVDG